MTHTRVWPLFRIWVGHGAWHSMGPHQEAPQCDLIPWTSWTYQRYTTWSHHMESLSWTFHEETINATWIQALEHEVGRTRFPPLEAFAICMINERHKAVLMAGLNRGFIQFKCYPQAQYPFETSWECYNCIPEITFGTCYMLQHFFFLSFFFFSII